MKMNYGHVRICLLTFVVACIWTVIAATPTITGVTAQQRYPWNGKVDITYNVTGDVVGYALTNKLVTTLKVTAKDKVANRSYTAVPAALSGDPTFTTGAHSIVWDLDYQGITLKSTNVEFNVYCETTAALLYCVIDLSGGPNATSYPVTYLTTAPSSGFLSDTYRKTQLVLRRCEPGMFVMGRDQTVGSHRVWLTKPFYMGIFEVTQKQWTLVMGTWQHPIQQPTPRSDEGDGYPVYYVSYNDIRGNKLGYKWPSTANVDAGSFMGKLRSRTMLNFDLPTEAQWEYACLAGTKNVHAGGGWLYPDQSMAHLVGKKEPNAWGLYDMRSNVAEWTLDWFSTTLTYGTDPKGKTSGQDRVLRGGHYGIFEYETGCTSYARDHYTPQYQSVYEGFRLVMNLP